MIFALTTVQNLTLLLYFLVFQGTFEVAVLSLFYTVI